MQEMNYVGGDLMQLHGVGYEDRTREVGSKF